MTVEDAVRYLKEDQLAEYYAQNSDAEAGASFLADVLGLQNYRFVARDAIKVDFASYVLQFAKDQRYGPIRAASLFNIAQSLLQACTAGTSLQDSEATFKTALLGACRANPGVDSPYFSPEQVSRVGKFFAGTLFSHYRLYQYCFSFEQDLTEYTETLLVETPMIPSLDEALPEAEWKAQLEEAQLQQEASRKAAEEEELAKIESEKQEQVQRDRQEAHAARQAELAKKPATLEEAVEHMVALRLEQEKAVLAAEYKAKEDALLKKIESIEAKAVPLLNSESSKKK